MSIFKLVTSFPRLTLQNVLHKPLTRSISTNTSLFFKATPCLMGEPLKKKKRLDPAIVKARDERKKKKIEKQIRRLEKNARQLKPIDECEVPLDLLDDKANRERSLPELSPEVHEKRVLLQKQWAKYKYNQHLADVQMLDRLIYSQQQALDELKNDSQELYNEAIQIEFQLLPFTTKGPTNTPAIENYEYVDGDYQDVSKKWE